MLPNILLQGINDYSNTGTKVKHFEISNHLTWKYYIHTYKVLNPNFLEFDISW